MPAPLSVVIPTLDAEEELPACLAALVEGLEAGLIRELVVSDGGSSDGTRAIADAWGGTTIEGPQGRGGQLGRGVAASKGDWLLLLHADTQLSPGWTDAAIEHVRDYPGSAGWFRLEFRARGRAPRLVAAWANLRSRLFGLPYGDQALLLSRATLERVGGVPDLPIMEDVVLAHALKGRLRALHSTARTSARRYRDEGWIRRGSRNLLTLARFLLGADPNALAESYRRRR